VVRKKGGPHFLRRIKTQKVRTTFSRTTFSII